MTVTTRFAPSPTGRLHIGNVRTALLNWLLARRQGGRFLLRLDDTDTARSTEEYAQSIRDDLSWLGMAPDAEEKQSARMARYEEVLMQLAAAGHAYRAYETPDELDLMQDEIFGPILPIRGYARLDEALETVARRDRPLALYPFSHDRDTVERIIGSTLAGGVTVNDTLLHFAVHRLPFGGVGPSGMGQYHGRAGFDRFTHARAVFSVPCRKACIGSA